MRPCSSGPIRSRRHGLRCGTSWMPGRALLPTAFLITPPAARAPTPPIACSRAMGVHGCRSEQAMRTGSEANDQPMGGDTVKATRTLHDLGQSLWLDNITRNLLRTGVLRRYIDEFSITGLTSNPTIFDHAIKNSSDYDSDISRGASRAKLPEDLFFEL